MAERKPPKFAVTKATSVLTCLECKGKFRALLVLPGKPRFCRLGCRDRYRRRAGRAA